MVHYCGKECQKAHWKEHKQECAMAQLNARAAINKVEDDVRDAKLSEMMVQCALDSTQGTSMEMQRCSIADCTNTGHTRFWYQMFPSLFGITCDDCAFHVLASFATPIIEVYMKRHALRHDMSRTIFFPETDAINGIREHKVDVNCILEQCLMLWMPAPIEPMNILSNMQRAGTETFLLSGEKVRPYHEVSELTLDMFKKELENVRSKFGDGVYLDFIRDEKDFKPTTFKLSGPPKWPTLRVQCMFIMVPNKQKPTSCIMVLPFVLVSPGLFTYAVRVNKGIDVSILLRKSDCEDSCAKCERPDVQDPVTLACGHLQCLLCTCDASKCPKCNHPIDFFTVP